jgi:hypothetical protein
MQRISPKKFGMGALTFLFSAMLVGCEPPGPAEKAGKSIDNAGKDLKNAVDPRGPVEKAGAKIDEATGK